jgi:hypothetical protein
VACASAYIPVDAAVMLLQVHVHAGHGDTLEERCIPHASWARSPRKLLVSPSELLASPSELLASPSELSASPSELVASARDLLASSSELLASPS